MLRKLVNFRWNPFTESNSYTVITDEVHAVPATSPYWVRLKEVADEDYTDPTSGTPVYIRTAGGTPFAEVSTSPGLNEFRVDYDYKTGWVEFNSGNAADIILVCYRGTGSPVEAELVNNLQRFETATPYFGGDGSDGSLTVSSNTQLAEDPAGSALVYKQYTNVLIEAGYTLSIASGCHGLVLAVQGKLELESGAKIDVNSRGAAGGAGGGGSANGAEGGVGGYGGGGGGGGSATYEGGRGGSPYGMGGTGRGGSGGGVGAAGSAGVRAVRFEDDVCWRSLVNQYVPGAGGGGGGADGGAGGAGGGFILVNCAVFAINSGTLEAKGAVGNNGGSGAGGGGGGGGGTIIVLADRITGPHSHSYIQGTLCDVSAGAAGSGGGGGGNGGAGAAGYKRVIELYSYNIF